MSQLPSMVSARTSGSQSRPEFILAQIEAKHADFMEKLHRLVYGEPATQFTSRSPIWVLEDALAKNRALLADLPSEEELSGLLELIKPALTISSAAIVKREIAQLIGSFPNAAPADPETYIAALIYDILDTRTPDAIIVTACRELRRTSKFVPAIAEVLATAERHVSRWQGMFSLPDRLGRQRLCLERLVDEGEAALAKALQDINDGLRDANGKIVQRKIASSSPTPFIPYPSIVDEFNGTPYILAVVLQMSFDDQSRVAQVLAMRGRDAAMGIISPFITSPS